jgi:hypothetical protein
LHGVWRAVDLTGLWVHHPDEPEVVDLERQGVGHHRIGAIDEPEMQVRRGGVAAAAEPAELLAGPHVLADADLHRTLQQVTVLGEYTRPAPHRHMVAGEVLGVARIGGAPGAMSGLPSTTLTTVPSATASSGAPKPNHWLLRLPSPSNRRPSRSCSQSIATSRP